ncbi:hypothetical protein GCM10027592_35060 [Spirosoma flavus]
MRKIQLILMLVGLAVGTSYAQTSLMLTMNVSVGQQQTQHAATYLSARNEVAVRASANYTAGSAVTLQPGFVAQAGSVFSASIRQVPAQADEPGSQLSLRAYPNPFGRNTRIEYVLPQATQVVLTLTDAQGRVLSQPSTATWKEAGKYEVEVSGEDLPVGTYLYRLEAGYQQKTIRLVKGN